MNKQDSADFRPDTQYNDNTIPMQEATRMRLARLLRSSVSGPKAILFLLAEAFSSQPLPEKLYLKDIALLTDFTSDRVTRMAKELQSAGLAVWTHDGDGAEGTYLCLTEEGHHQLDVRQKALDRFFHSVVDRFGHERFMQLMQEFHALEAITRDELKKGESDANMA